MFARRSAQRWKRHAWDPVNVAVRRLFIKKFLTADAIRLNGVRYNPAGLIDADRDMANYLTWLATETGPWIDFSRGLDTDSNGPDGSVSGAASEMPMRVQFKAWVKHMTTEAA